MCHSNFKTKTLSSDTSHNRTENCSKLQDQPGYCSKDIDVICNENSALKSVTRRRYVQKTWEWLKSIDHLKAHINNSLNTVRTSKKATLSLLQSSMQCQKADSVVCL